MEEEAHQSITDAWENDALLLHAVDELACLTEYVYKASGRLLLNGFIAHMELRDTLAAFVARNIEHVLAAPSWKTNMEEIGFWKDLVVALAQRARLTEVR